MNIKRRGRSAFAGLVAAGAAMALAVGGGSAALAAPGDDGSPLILPGEGGQPITGTVLVHKHEQGDAAGAAANGLPQTVDTATIAGVEFTAQQVISVTVDGLSAPVTFELDTNDGWHNAAKLDYNAALDTWTYDGATVTDVNLGAEVVRDTGMADVYSPAVFDDLPIGLYHFAETATPNNVTPSAPWVMTVPLTHPTELNSWLYEINVYPKNSTTNIEKTVDDAAGVKLGDLVTWTIRADIPRTANPSFDAGTAASPGNLEFLAPSRYAITDSLDGRLALTSIEVAAVGADGEPLVTPVLEAADYTVSPDPIPGVGLNRGQEVVVEFTPAGLAKLGLIGSTPGAQVQVVIETHVAALVNEPAAPGEQPGIVQNQAFLFPNDSSVDAEGIPSNVPDSRWGDILIRKVDASNGTVPIEGAVFSVFTSKEEAELGNNPIAFGDPGTNTFTTGEDGRVRISGLRYTAYADGEELAEDDPRYRTYWLVEVKSAEGFELLAEPIEVIVDAAGVEVTVTQIENAPSNGGFELPLTGGTGTGIMLISGIAILGAVLLVARNRRNSELAAE